MSLLALVHVHYVLCVDGQVLVGVDDHAEQTRVRLGGGGGEEEKTRCPSTFDLVLKGLTIMIIIIRIIIITVKYRNPRFVFL